MFTKENIKYIILSSAICIQYIIGQADLPIGGSQFRIFVVTSFPNENRTHNRHVYSQNLRHCATTAHINILYVHHISYHNRSKVSYVSTASDIRVLLEQTFISCYPKYSGNKFLVTLVYVNFEMENTIME